MVSEGFKRVSAGFKPHIFIYFLTFQLLTIPSKTATPRPRSLEPDDQGSLVCETVHALARESRACETVRASAFIAGKNQQHRVSWEDASPQAS